MPDKWSHHQNNSTNVRLERFKLAAFSSALGLAHRLAPNRTKQLMLAKFFAPRKPPLTEIQAGVLDRGQRFTVTANGQALVCWRWATGPAVLCIHGWNSRGVHFHRFFQPLAAAGYSVITYDAPAHGQSEGRGTNYFEFSDAVRAVLTSDHGPDIRAIIAHSLGGGAVLNALSKEGGDYRTVLLAPALRLREMLLRAFNRHRVPERLYRSLINDLQQKHGYDLERDNPWNLAGRIRGGFLIIQDRDDQTISFLDSRKLVAEYDSISLIATSGLGHNRLMSDGAVIDQSIAYLTGREPELERQAG